ncbi:response regulator, partial [Cyanobacterium stanieri LEGE 03274]
DNNPSTPPKNPSGNGNSFMADIELDDLELDRFSEFHLLAQEMIELVVRIRESTSDIQFLVDETDQLGKNIRDITDQLQEQINKSRMVPFAQNADRLPLPIRKIAQGYDKQVQLKVEGREVLIDKMILEHLWDPLLQIVKNSVTHGIEQPEDRVANGKEAMGTITVRAFLQGPQTVISVSDDGGGIDAHKVKQKAIQKNLISPEEANSLKDQEIYDFLFNAGFTTKEKADSHAGRGVGLDIVRNKLNEIRGSVSIDSIPGRGTTFTMRLPLTLTIGKALCCLNNNVRIAFPIDGIEDTQTILRQDINKDKDGNSYINWNNSRIPLRSLNQLLQYNRQMSRSFMYNSANNDENSVPIIILRGGNDILAVEVDQILPEEEIVIKQISGPLPKPKGISGATVRSDGTIMPVADVIELIKIAEGSLSNQVKSQMFPSVAVEKQAMSESQVNITPLVLIVDDSITVREMLSITFSKEGYRVEQARDGQEAWQKLRSGLPCNLIFCDIEMPRMNGLELLQHLQEDEELSHIPMAILSSRGSQKHQKIAAELGACAYLIKPCVDKELIDSAQRMMNGEVLLEGSTRVPTARMTDIQAEDDKSTFGAARRKTSSAPMVLIVDDSVVVREMLSLSFKKAGYEVEVARDGQDAWEKLSEGLPCEIILCDIEMPRMNGLELLARMQQDDVLSQLPVAMVTSRGAEKHRSIAADLGARAYFTKPYIEDELLDVAKRLIDGEVFLTSATAQS